MFYYLVRRQDFKGLQELVSFWESLFERAVSKGFDAKKYGLKNVEDYKDAAGTAIRDMCENNPNYPNFVISIEHPVQFGADLDNLKVIYTYPEKLNLN